MESLSARIRASVYERVRYSAKKARMERLLSQNGVGSPWIGSLELLETLLSIRAILDRRPEVLVDVGAHRGVFAAGADMVLGFNQIISTVA